MQLRYNFRVYPTPGQQIELARAFGCARVVFNDGVRLRQQAREAGEKYISDGELSRRLITEAKLTPQRAWLGDVSAVVLQQALADLNTAYRNFFASITGERQGRKLAPPRFRSRKDHRQAIRFTQNSRFRVLDNGRLRLPKIGDVPVRWSRPLPSEPTSVTVVKDAAGRYFASFVVTTTDEPLPEVGSEVGIDLGLTHFAVLSDGQHKLSTTIVRENQAIYVEDLCVAGLGRTRLAKSVHDAGWSQFVNMLEYKAARYGRTFGKVDRFFPSTRMCSQCGRVTDKMVLSVRSWACLCGSHHDRDVNAALNVLAAGQAESRNDRGAQVRLGLVPAPRREAVTHPDVAWSTRSVEGISAV